MDKNGAEEGADGRILPFHLKSADLSKEERQVWYGEIFIGEDGRKMTFSSYEKFFFHGFDYLSSIVHAAFDEYVEYIRQKIRKRVMKKKDKVIRDYFKKGK